jgi:hypothetical protein
VRLARPAGNRRSARRPPGSVRFSWSLPTPGHRQWHRHRSSRGPSFIGTNAAAARRRRPGPDRTCGSSPFDAASFGAGLNRAGSSRHILAAQSTFPDAPRGGNRSGGKARG